MFENLFVGIKILALAGGVLAEMILIILVMQAIIGLLSPKE